jgi:hypothetical protein
MDNGTGDTIHYTTDGSDPRNPGGAIGGTASTYSSAVELVTSPVTIRARARDPLTGEWSALTETEFNLGLVPPSSSNLVVSEFMYHPANPSTIEEAAGFTDDGDFEFLELKNTDSVLSVDLSDVVFTSGITFAFGGTAHETLGPNQRVIIVRNLAGFQERYGHALDSRIAGEFADSLSNGGELVTLSVTGDPTTVLHSFTYLDKDPWAACADGDGHSLVLLDPDSAPDHDDAVNWTFSRHFGGELGGNYLDFDFQVWVSHNFSAVDAANPAVSAELADPDDDGLVNLLEFAFGTDPTLWSSVAQPIFRIDSDGVNDFFTASFQRPKYVLPFIYEIQVSDDLNTWLTLPEANIVAAVPIADPISRFVQESWRITTPVRAESAPLFFRFKVEFEGQGEGEG